MTNLTKRHLPRRTLTFIGLSSLAVTALISACSSTDSNPTASAAAGTGGTGTATSGGAGAPASAGSANHAGSSGAGGAATAGSGGQAAGGAGLGGSAGTGGNGGNAGMAGGGGTGGVVCAADDKCCDDPDKTAPGTCGCGTPENDSDGDGTIDCKPGHFLEAEDGVLSHVDVAVTPSDSGAGGANGAGGADGAGGAGGGDSGLPEVFTIGSDAKASKGKYIESPAGFTSDGLPGPARATYSFDIPVAQMYTIWGRFYTPSRDHNRFWVKVDDGVWTKLRDTTGETWFWYAFHKEGEFDIPIQFAFTKGAHTFAIASDSDGARIDRFYVTPGGDRPAGDDTVCNPPHTIQVGDVCQSSCGMLTGNSCDPVMCAGKTLLPAYDCAVCCTL